MKILIDNSNLFAGGGIQVATSFLYDLLSMEDDNKYHVVQSVNSAKQINKLDFDKRFLFYDLSDRHLSIFKRKKKLQDIENTVMPNVTFTVFGPSYYKSKCTKVVGFALGQILYPKSPYFKKISWVSYIQIKLLSYVKSYFFKKYSDVLIYESDDAKKIYNDIINDKLIIGYTVPNTVNNIFFNKNHWKDIDIIKSKFDILYLTANYPHKNIHIVPKVIDRILEKGELKNFKFHLSVSKEEMNFEDRYDKYINYIGKVDINQVPQLYSKMNLLFMPTLLETFSTTYLEAMVSNIPIVTSNLSFAKDICGNAALFSEPMCAEDYASKILLLYNDNDLYRKLIIEGKLNLKRFGTSMDRTKKYLEILKKHAQ